MKKKFLFLFVLLLFSCEDSENYLENQLNKKYNITIVYIDEKSIDSIGGVDNLDRSYYSKIIEELETNNPEYIVLKFILDTDKEKDEALINTLAQHNNIILEAAHMAELNNIVDAFNSLQIDDIDYFVDYETGLGPNRKFLANSPAIGYANMLIDGNDFIGMNMVVRIKNAVYPSLALKVLQLASRENYKIENESININGIEKHLDPEGTSPMGITDSNFYQSYSALDLLSKKYDSDDMTDSIVIIAFMEEKNQLIKFQEIEKTRAELVADSINTLLIDYYGKN